MGIREACTSTAAEDSLEPLPWNDSHSPPAEGVGVYNFPVD